MTVQVTRVPYGRPAAEALRSAINSAKGDGPLTPVTVVVPSNYVGVATRRMLASGELGPVCGTGIGLAAVSFLTVYRLAELLGSSALAGARTPAGIDARHRVPPYGRPWPSGPGSSPRWPATPPPRRR